MNPDDPIRTDGEFIHQVRELRRALQTDPTGGTYVFWAPTRVVARCAYEALEPQEKERVLFLITETFA